MSEKRYFAVRLIALVVGGFALSLASGLYVYQTIHLTRDSDGYPVIRFMASRGYPLPWSFTWDPRNDMHLHPIDWGFGRHFVVPFPSFILGHFLVDAFLFFVVIGGGYSLARREKHSNGISWDLGTVRPENFW